MDVIKKDTSIKEARFILEAHGCPLGFGWEIVLGNLLKECDYLEVHDFGKNAYFHKVFN